MFVVQWRNLLARDDPAIGFSKRRVRTLDNHTSVRYRQTVSGLEVHASTLIVQTNTTGGVEAVVNDIMHDSEAMTSGRLSLQPATDGQAAESRAAEWMGQRYPRLKFQATRAEQVLYSPLVVGRTGDVQLTWRTEVGSPDDSSVRELILVNAQTRDIAFHHTLVFHASSRRVWDSVDDETRTENDGPTGFHDEVNRAFDYLGDTYEFYWDYCEQRDSWNDAGGTPPNGEEIAWVRYQSWSYWNPSTQLIELGPGTVTDDTVGHEFTHGVISTETMGSTYSGESAAITESLCDMFGEWIDQEYDHPTGDPNEDDDSEDWVLFEDDTSIDPNLMPWRRMDDPTQIYTNDPCGYGSHFDGSHAQPDYRPDMPTNPTQIWYGNWYVGYPNPQDSGGAHHNLGVGNKLCFLLTSGTGGQPFRGYTVSGFGRSGAASLFYKALCLYLPGACTYSDLSFGLTRAATHLNFNSVDRANIRKACEAVAISPPGELEAHWKLDEASGTTASDSAGSNTGTLHGGTQWMPTGGRVGGALSFDGIDANVALSSIDALEGKTASITAWVKPHALSGYGPILTQYEYTGGNNHGYYLCLYGGAPAFYLNDAGGSSGSVNADEWCHVAGTQDGVTLKVYVDGVFGDDFDGLNQSGINHAAYIGSSGTGNYFNGLIDDVRVYNYALSDNEIAGLSEGGNPPALVVRNASRAIVALIDVEGNLFLAGTLTSGTPQASASDEFCVQKLDGQNVVIVAIINMATGNMVIAGTQQQGVPSPSNFIVKNTSGNPVAYIDTSGNLRLAGNVYPNWDF